VEVLLGEHLLIVDPLAMTSAQGGNIRVVLEARAAAGRHYQIASRIQMVGIDGATVLALLGYRKVASGGKTDASITLSGEGATVRDLAGTLTGDVRIVVGPGRIAKNKRDFGGDPLARLLETLNPFRETEKETNLECAVLRFPIRNGVAVIDRGLGVQTDKVNIIATGAVNLRDETLDLAFHPKVREGLGLSVQATLADMVRVQGTFANPIVGIDPAGSARTAINISAAVLTAGVSLVVTNLYDRALAAKPCEAALGRVQPSGANAIQQTLKAPAQLIDKLLGR